MNNGRRSRRFCPNPNLHPKEDPSSNPIAPALRVSYGFCGRALPGGRCPQAIPHLLNLLAAAEGLARRRHLVKSVRPICRPTQRAGTVALGRDIYRRDVRAGKKRGLCVGKTKRGKGTKVVVVADGEGLPVGLHVCSASPHEATLAEATLAATQGQPERLIGDRAYDSDPLRERLAHLGIQCFSRPSTAPSSATCS